MNHSFTPKPGKLMTQVRETLRFHHYAYSTEKSYVMKYILVFHPAGQPTAVQIYSR